MFALCSGLFMYRVFIALATVPGSSPSPDSHAMFSPHADQLIPLGLSMMSASWPPHSGIG